MFECATTFPTATSHHVKHGFHILTNTKFKHVTSTFYHSSYLVFEYTYNVTYFHVVIGI